MDTIQCAYYLNSFLIHCYDLNNIHDTIRVRLLFRLGILLGWFSWFFRKIDWFSLERILQNKQMYE